MVETMRSELAAASKTRGATPQALSVAQAVGLEVVAYLTLRTTIGALSMSEGGKATMATLANRVGRSVENEVWMRQVKAEKPDLFDVTMREVAEYRDPRVREKVARIMAKKGGVDQEWSERGRAMVGIRLLDYAARGTGLISFPVVREGRQTVRYVALTAESMEKIEDARALLAEMSPALMPCIIPPKPWTGTRSGGYHSGLFRRLHLIKTWSNEVVEEFDNLDMGRVLAAVNAVQATPWRVNARVLEVLEEAIASERAIGKLPARVEEVPPFPEAERDNPEVVRQWKRAAAKVHTRNRKTLGKRLQVAQVAAVARRFVGRPIWFPHQMDFRGRMYAMPVGLNPQGPDYAKGLLTFDRAYAIEDEVAAGWLMISGANRYGVDKSSLLDRIAWVGQNEEAILAVDADPWGPAYDFWTKADEPWQFLAWCFDYAAFKREGYGYKSSLPIGLDGSCNGLQHYSAALRDPEGGRAVNLIGGALPSDIYGIVAAKAEAKVREFLRPEGPDTGTIPTLDRARNLWAEKGIDEKAMAQAWLAFGLDRKVTKRAVMTLPYGATQYSAREFIEDAIEERLAKGGGNPFYQGDDPVEARYALFKASLWLQPLVWTAIGETVKAARVGMDWLQACARVVCAQGLPVNWRTPDGFLVQQAYRDWNSHRVTTILDGSVVEVHVREISASVDKRAQAQGIAPNWVHSMDACALRMFVNIAVDNGLHDFALVHDSYGAPAAKVDLMVQCLKASFIHLYQDYDPVAEFYMDILDQLPDSKAIRALPPPPPKGDLDLGAIRHSDYFFA
jgi:DNA-directed RNA polymerase